MPTCCSYTQATYMHEVASSEGLLKVPKQYMQDAWPSCRQDQHLQDIVCVAIHRCSIRGPMRANHRVCILSALPAAEILRKCRAMRAHGAATVWRAGWLVRPQHRKLTCMRWRPTSRSLRIAASAPHISFKFLARGRHWQAAAGCHGATRSMRG